jgi:hypothetical protein
MENDLESQIRQLIDRGARPVSLQEVSQRRAPSAPRAAWRRRTLVTVATACAAGLVAAFASPGTPSRPAAQASRSGKDSAFLTAATEGIDGQTTVTVTFTESGQPQSITAPASS